MSEFQNPQHDPGAEKRLVLVFVLTFLAILATQMLMPRRQPQLPAQQPQQQQQAAPAPTEAAAPAQAVAAKPAAPVAVKQAEAEAEIVIENELYRITFTNRGAQVKSWVLKKYSDDHGKQLELVHPIAAPEKGYPLSLWTYDAELRKKLNEALYLSSAQGTQAAPADLSFEFSDGETVVRKRFRFDHSYLVEVEIEVVHQGEHAPAYPAWPAGFGDQIVPASYAAATVVRHTGDDIERLYPKNVSGGATVHGPFYWAGTADQYFAAVFLPDDPRTAVLVMLHESVQVPENLLKPDPNKMETVSVLGAAVGDAGGITRQRMFVGPKTVDVLQSVHASAGGQGGAGPDLEGLVDFGKWLGFIARPLFLWLKWTYENWVSNWGWSIMILTIIINVALLPLKLSSMKSTLKMAKLAPQMKAIQEKYKKYKFNDPRRAAMQQEVSALYKKEGVNPIGGCVPMLLQFPFLVAFYSMLSVAIELRHARWLWIPDLAAPDPYYILPIGIGVSMYMVQKMTPQGAMDPMQQKMMNTMMPVMLAFISATLASGLGVYWAMGNVIAILQQTALNRTRFGREVREEMQKRAAKKR